MDAKTAPVVAEEAHLGTPLTPQEAALLTGEMQNLTPQDRQTLVLKICQSLRLNPWTGPIRMLFLDKKWTIYFTKDGADQLARIHGASCVITSRTLEDDMYIVTGQARLGDRVMDTIGIVPYVAITLEWKTRENGSKYAIEHYTPLNLTQKINARMKGDTKCTRRGLLAICGLGALVEDERDTMIGSIEIDEDPLEGHPQRQIAARAQAAQAPVQTPARTPTQAARPRRPAPAAEVMPTAEEPPPPAQAPTDTNGPTGTKKPFPPGAWEVAFWEIIQGLTDLFATHNAELLDVPERVANADEAQAVLEAQLTDLCLLIQTTDETPMTGDQVTSLGRAAQYYLRAGLKIPGMGMAMSKDHAAAWLAVLSQVRPTLEELRK